MQATSRSFSCLLFVLLGLTTRSYGFSATTTTRNRVETKASSSALFVELGLARRSFLGNSAATVLIGTLVSVGTISPKPSLAVVMEEEEGLVSTSTVANRLRAVPTFTLVDPQGVPYMVVGEDAKVTGYFFTEYGEAKRILNLARTSADKALKEAKDELRRNRKMNALPALSKQEEDDEIGINPWTTARISSITLDVAATLVIKSISSRNYFQIAPSDVDVDDALALTNRTDLAEGKVPLFYMADFTINGNQSPLYFRKSELLTDFKQANPRAPVPPVKVTEFFSVLKEMVKPGGTDEELKALVFMAPKESEARARECAKASKGESPFLLGQRIIVL